MTYTDEQKAMLADDARHILKMLAHGEGLSTSAADLGYTPGDAEKLIENYNKGDYQ